MLRRTFTRNLPVGVGAWIIINNYFIKPFALSSGKDDGEDEEFLIRQQLVEALINEGNQSLIPKDLFTKNSSGKYNPIPSSLTMQYLSLARIGMSPVAANPPKINVKSKKKTVKVQKESLFSRIGEVAALYNQNMIPRAQQELTRIMNDEKLKTVRDLPQEVFDVLPSQLSATRVEFEKANGTRIDSKRLSSIRVGSYEVPAEIIDSPVRTSPEKKSRIYSPEKVVAFEDSDESANEKDVFNLSDVLSSVTGGTISTASKSSKRSKSQSLESRNHSNKKCDDKSCGCRKRVTKNGCCDVCRIHFSCECGDCMFAGGHESADLKARLESEVKRTLLESEAQHYATISQKSEEQRLGYVFDRRKETIASESSSGRQIHEWRVGRLSGYVLCCDKAFLRFYKTSSSTLYNMKNKSSVIKKGAGSVAQQSQRMGSRIGEFTDDVPHKSTVQELKQFSKKASLIHSVQLDEDEKAALRWAPMKGSNAIEEAYGWMSEHFGLVAEDMPNR